MKKAYLIILDGFGLGAHDTGDAVYQAQTPFFDHLMNNCPTSHLKNHGKCVGLPSFQTGGSEVGHITLGAGREVKHLLTKINDQIDDGSFFANPVLRALFKKAQKKKKIHFMGLLSDGGIHSFSPHLKGLKQMADEFGIENVYLHPFLDGRDVGERTAKQYLEEASTNNWGEIATIGGRFFAMDRDDNHDRVSQHYDVLANPSTRVIDQSWEASLETYYQSGDKSDYYLPPQLLNKAGQIQADDIVICFNYRSDRMRQLSSAFCDPDFDGFPTPIKIEKENYGTFGPYCEGAQEPFDLGGEKTKNTLGEIVAQQGGNQLRISETEKFNHVTFFFSGETKALFEKEERILIPSPKCASYAEKPEMAAYEQTDALLKAIEEKDFQLIVQNYANADLVGHSGELKATVKAIEILDKCLSQVVPAAMEKGYEVFVTADHGNADIMILDNGEPNAAHTKNLVPFIWANQSKEDYILKKEGALGDVAPTILDTLELDKPEEMTGQSRIIR